MALRNNQTMTYGALDNDAKKEMEPVFNEGFLRGVEKHFKDKITSMEMGIKTRVETDVLHPVLSMMRNLIINHTTNTIGAGDHSLDGLLALIIKEKTDFKTRYTGTLKNETIKLVIDALSTIEKEIHDHIKSSHLLFAERCTAKVTAARSEMKTIQWEKTKDVCCLLACVCWCPIENLITLCNCFGCDKNGYCCRNECTDVSNVSGRYSMWAPVGSVRNLYAHYKEQDAKQDAIAPTAQRMI